LIETLVAIGRLIESGAAQFNACAIDPGAHHLRRHLAGTLDLSGLAVDNASRFASAQCAACAMHCGVERVSGMLVLDSLENDRLLALRAADEPALAWKCRCSSFTHNPQLVARVLFAPGVVVMVVHFLDNRRSQNLRHAS